MRGLTSTIALVVVGAGLGGYIYFVESKRPAGGLETKDKVFTVESDALEELSVTSQGETTTLRKEGDKWKITSPIAADADANEVSSLTSALTGLEVNRVIDENASNLAEYGLAEPRIKIAYKAKSGSGEVHIGEKTATQSDLYAVKAGEKRVFLVSGFQETSLAKKTFDLRDKRVLNFERDKVDTIELMQPGSPMVQLARSGSEWLVRQPIAARGDYSGVEGLLTRLSTASMSKLVDPNSPESFGLESPSATVTLGAGSNRATLEFGAEKDGAVYVRDRSRPTMIFAVEPSLATDVKKSVADLPRQGPVRVPHVQRPPPAHRARRGDLRVSEGRRHRHPSDRQVAAHASTASRSTWTRRRWRTCSPSCPTCARSRSTRRARPPAPRRRSWCRRATTLTSSSADASSGTTKKRSPSVTASQVSPSSMRRRTTRA